MAPPIYVKGGVWTNVEDQILKAAVSKYGLTQWSRVASLLPKKTAKQAKARWNEYLNPTINRNTWSPEEDDKLLSLAKLLPNQWRSISLIMGRTATHCVERYQKLLEDAAKRNKQIGDGTEEEEEDEEMGDMKLTGPGIESLPALGNAFESLPSRPDAEDMDDDEREMLSEAKARLANTQGKKAKRKDRERMLEESKRVALLQKRRELKAAGISISLTLKNKAKRKEFDYNADIPHERQPKPGIYDVRDEVDLNEDTRLRFQKQVNYKGLAPKEPDDKAAIKFKKAAKNDLEKAKAATRLAAGAITSIDAYQETKRRKLELPAPGTASTDEDLKLRIAEKSQNLLLVQNELEKTDGTSVPLKQQEQTENTALSGAKLSRKQIVSGLKELLATVPQPKVTSQLVFPQFDPNLDTLAPGMNIQDGVPHTDQLDKQLELLKQVEEQKAKARVSRVIQRGLEIPDPDVIDTQLPGNDPILVQIRKEFKAIVRFDLQLNEADREQDSVELPTMDEKALAEVERLIEREPQTPLPKSNFLHETYSLPKLDAAIDKAFELLHILDSSANEADKRLAIMEESDAKKKVYDDLKARILENSIKIAEADLEEKVLLEIIQREDEEIERRSATLHELVEDVKAAEHRSVRRVQ